MEKELKKEDSEGCMIVEKEDWSVRKYGKYGWYNIVYVIMEYM